VNEVVLPAAAADAPCDGASFTMATYTSIADGFLRVTTNNSSGTVGLLRTCNAFATCVSSQRVFAIAPGVEIFLSVEGAAGSTVSFTLTEEPSLALGAACVLLPTNGTDIDICDAEADLYCSGADGCAASTPLLFGSPIDVVSVAGVLSETCYGCTCAGTYTVTTEGACATPGFGLNDPAVRIVSNAAGPQR
jgi:hypothetical protein